MYKSYKPIEFVDLRIRYHASRKPLIVYSEWDIGLDYEYTKSKFLIKICKKYDVPFDILRVILSIFTDLAQAKNTLGFIGVDILQKKLQEKDSILKQSNTLFPKIELNNLRVGHYYETSPSVFCNMTLLLKEVATMNAAEIVEIDVSENSDFYESTIRNIRNIMEWLQQNSQRSEYVKLKMYLDRKLKYIVGHMNRYKI